jgi:alpha-glucosidase (family GH31 glycosyl hydrolase)
VLVLRVLLGLLLLASAACASGTATELDAGVDAGTDAGLDPVAPWPQWAFHHWVWENESTQESAIALVDDYLARDIPVGAIIIDSPWETSYNSFVFEPSQYPDPQAMVDYFHSSGVRVLLWMVSAINLDSPLYAEAAAARYFTQVDAVSGPGVVDWWKGDGSLIDYFKPDAVQWWHEQMDQAIALGIDGWKCDGTDPYILSAPYSPGLGRNVGRNEYGFAYYRDSFDYLREKLGDDRIITARPIDNQGTDTGADIWVYAPTDINWAGWVGDQDGTFEGIRAALSNMYWSSERGYVAHGSDIGGFRTDRQSYPERGRPKDAFIRWAQLGAFSPIMENGGGGEHRPWMFDEETTDIYREFVGLHYVLLPYLMKHGAVAFENGTSLTTYLTRADYTYLLGPDVFVAPMLEEGTSRTLSFPEGSWVYLFDASKTFTGPTEATLEIPMAEFPVFVREGCEIAETLLAAREATNTSSR